MTHVSTTEKILYSFIKSGVAGVFAAIVVGGLLRYLLPEWMNPWPLEGHSEEGEKIAMALVWGSALVVGTIVFRSSMKRLR